jgi:putative peptide zinc metalloprotease protein
MTEPAVTELAAASRLVVAHDGDEYVLGRPDLGIYVAVPEPGAVFVEALRAGASLADATARASSVAGSPVDGEDFLAGLSTAGLLAPPAAAGEPTGDRAPARGAREIRWIEGVSPAAARRLFGPVAWTGYALATLFVVLVLALRSDFRPSFEHFWWLPDPVLSVLTLAVIGYATAAAHEAWHWLAGRAIGVPAVFRVSYRGIFLVFETDVTQIATVPRRRRYGVFLAGMAFEVTLVAVALALRLAHRADAITLAGWLDRLLAAVVLVHVMRIVWQWAALFMRSDGYAVLANALRCHDLFQATWLTTKERLWRLTGPEATELASISGHDRRVARWFGFGYLAGLVVMAWMLLVFIIPSMISIGWWVGYNLVDPAPATVAFWESVAVVAVVFGQYAVIPVLAVRERGLRRVGALR